MAGLGIYGQRVALSPPKKPGTTTPVQSTYDAYNNQQTAPATPTGISNAINYTTNIAEGYTPQQELAMRNRVRATDTAQNVGSTSKMRDYMASMGYGGSGAETAALGNLWRGQNATRQGALSDIDISNSQLANQNAYQKGGMLNQLAGMGEGARQFDLGQGANMYQFGTTFDEQKRQADLARTDYMRQLEDWKNQIGWGSSGSPNTSINPNTRTSTKYKLGG